VVPPIGPSYELSSSPAVRVVVVDEAEVKEEVNTGV